MVTTWTTMAYMMKSTLQKEIWNFCAFRLFLHVSIGVVAPQLEVYADTGERNTTVSRFHCHLSPLSLLFHFPPRCHPLQYMTASKAQLEATDRAAAAETRAAATVAACDEKDARIAALEAMVARLDSEVRF